MIVTGSFATVRARHEGSTGLVPTMGYLHEGHLALIEAARGTHDTVVMSLFVNALQFGDETDLASYPRDTDRDLAIAEQAGVDVVFAPTHDEMYEREPLTRVVVPAMTQRMEGLHRPGHFDGVATVVTKLLAGIQPHAAYFGRKDAQQVAIVTRMTRDLSLPVAIVPVPTVRETDGLALSSRNVRLDDAARRAAGEISRALLEAADTIEAGEKDPGVPAAAVRSHLEEVPGVTPEYVEWADGVDLGVPAVVRPGAFLAVAARVDGVRLIDNIHVDEGPEGVVVDRGRWIEGTSMLYRGEDD
jgi:pantoate--beta-alanine ligase